jgi:hypothetical protein
MPFQKSSSLGRNNKITGVGFQRVHGSTDNPKALKILKLPGSEIDGEAGGDDHR